MNSNQAVTALGHLQGFSGSLGYFRLQGDRGSRWQAGMLVIVRILFGMGSPQGFLWTWEGMDWISWKTRAGGFLGK